MTPGLRTIGGGIFKCETVRDGGRLEGGVNCGSANYGRARGHVSPLPTATAPMVLGRENIEHGLSGEGGEVPDGLHPRDGLSSLLKCVCMGLKA